MTAPNSSTIDNALVALLGADSTLLGYCPNGVYWGEAPAGATRFVLVSLIDELDEATFDQGRAIEDTLYLVKAVMFETGAGQIVDAAARIDALLQDQPLWVGSPPADVPGYAWMATFREGRVRYVEADPDNLSKRWQHRGGQYRIQMAVDPSVGSV